MSAKAPIALVLIALVLLGYVLLFERGRPTAREIESRSGLLLESLVRDRITRIRIASGDQRLVLHREGEGFDETWTLEEPRNAPADPELVEDYLRNWEFAMPVRTLGDPTEDDLRNFGMEAHKAEVTFEMGPAKTRISLGSGAPVDGGGYVRVDEQKPVVVVSKDVVALFERSTESFELKNDAGAPLLSDLFDAGLGDGSAADAATP